MPAVFLQSLAPPASCLYIWGGLKQDRQPIIRRKDQTAAPYKIYFVNTAKSKSGKSAEAAKWWQEKGKAWFESSPSTKSVQAYAAQFSLGGDYFLEFWQEIENYAALDRWDEDMLQHPDKYSPMMKEASDLFDWGPARIMGDWPESGLGLEE